MIKVEQAMDDRVAEFEDYIKQKYIDILDDFGIYLDDITNSIYLSELYIEPAYRGDGNGNMIMNEILEFADNVNLPVVLIPEPEKLTKNAEKRLITFYKRFGFVINKGRNRDCTLSLPFSTTMYRKPKS